MSPSPKDKVTAALEAYLKAGLTYRDATMTMHAERTVASVRAVDLAKSKLECAKERYRSALADECAADLDNSL